MEKYITNKKGEKFVVLIDDEDEELYDRYRWYISGKYARCHINKDETNYLHRLILNASKKDIVDHINGNRLDNRKCNLRLCNKYQNAQNKSRHSRLTIYKGIWKNKKRWGSSIMVKRKKIHIGTFDTQEQAARAYDEAAKKHFGEFAKLNFPA